MTWVIVMVFAVMWAVELPGLLHRRQKAELATFAALWVVGLTLALLVHYGVHIDLVTKALRSVFEPIGLRLIQPPAV